jgi:hypothetical protein
MTPARPRLHLEPLTDRCLLTTFGVPWPDAGHLTLSFAPDGTATPYGPSTLGATLGAVTPTATWQREVLRAFQTWAAAGNIDIGLTGDNGLAFGVNGAVQADSRFGDIRIAAAAEAASLLASASPFSLSGTTLSGDVVFNSSMPFGVGPGTSRYDIFSAALHEAGHVFGLDHSTEPGSAINATYGYRTGLTATDIANLRALYGARTPDAFDANGSNNTLATADALPSDALLGNRLSARGDLTTPSDVDFYKFNVLPLVGITGVAVRLQGGVSLLAPSLTVYDRNGRVVAATSSTDPLTNDLTLRFNTSLLGGTYYVKVDGATSDVFAVGGYRLAVDYLTTGTILAPLDPVLSPVVDLHTDDLVGQLLSPLSRPAPDARFDYTYQGVIEDAHDVDRFRITAPATGPIHLNVLAWALQPGGLDPQIQVYDATRNQPVAFQVLANDDGLMSIQVPDPAPGTDYVVSVLARNPGDTGSYFLAIDFNQFQLTQFDGVTTDTLSPGATSTATLNVTEAGVYELLLSAEGLAGGVTMTVYDATGNIVCVLGADAGKPAVTAVRYLAEGTYTVQYAYRSPSGTTAAPIDYSLFLYKISDGAGPYATGSGSTTSPSPGTTSTDGTYTYQGSSATRPTGSPYYF